MDINKLMQEATKMQKQLEQQQKILSSTEFSGSASNGLVKVTCNGDYKILSVEIDENILNKEDKEMIQDLVMIATNEAIQKVDEAKKSTLSSLAPGLGF